MKIKDKLPVRSPGKVSKTAREVVTFRGWEERGVRRGWEGFNRKVEREVAIVASQ